MDAYIYNADIYCADCTRDIKAKLDAAGKRPPDPVDEYSFDSDDYPKGPYADGGGEADCPQHCGGCGEFLENPLTCEGYRYLRELEAREGEYGDSAEQYREFYPEAFKREA